MIRGLRTPEEDALFRAIKVCSKVRQRESVLAALTIATLYRGLPSRDMAIDIATRVLCLLDACPMRPKEMGVLLGIDAETASFKNALTHLRHLDMVEAVGPKHNRIYRKTA